MIRENRTKTILKNGGYAIGAFISLMDPAVYDVMSRSGFDFIVMDNEHSHYDKLELKMMILAAEGKGIDATPLVRIRENSVGNIKNALDMGFLGVQVPMVSTVEDAKNVVDAAYYPPIGHRGFGSGQHAIGYGALDRKEYSQIANREVLNVIQIETVEGIKNLDAILEIPEIDVIFVGAVDLSCSMGEEIMLNRRHPELVKVFNDAVRKIAASGKVAGVAVGTEEDIREAIELGARYLCVGTDLPAIKAAAVKTVNMCHSIVDSYKK